MQRARVCSKRGLCTWRGSQVGEPGTIYCRHAWGLNPLCSRSPGIGVLTPGPARSWAVPTSLGVLSPAALFWDCGAGLAAQPWSGAVRPVHGPSASSAFPWSRSWRPKGFGGCGWERRECRMAGRLAPTPARRFLAELALGRDAPWLPPCPVPPAGARPDPTWAIYPRSTRIPWAGGPRESHPPSGTRPEMPQSRSERCGERRAQLTSPRRFPVCTGRCRLDRSFL